MYSLLRRFSRTLSGSSAAGAENDFERLGGRTALEEKYFGYEWSNALQGLGADPLRVLRAPPSQKSAGHGHRAQGPGRAAENRAGVAFWANGGRIQRFTPYLVVRNRNW